MPAPAIPCGHTPPGSNDCPLCKIARTHERYARHWWRREEKTEDIGRRTEERKTDKPRVPKGTSLERYTACIHKGAPTGASVPCGECGGHGQSLPLLVCALHGTCTEARRARDQDVPCCLHCKDRTLERTEDRGRKTEERPSPPPSALSSALRPPSSVLFTGGIGDVFAVESVMPVALREELTRVYIACPAAREIAQLWSALVGHPAYPRLRDVVVLPTGRTTLYDLANVQRHVGEKLEGTQDYSIKAIFPRHQPYTGSTWLARPLGALPAGLPAGPYVVIVPGSDWYAPPARALTGAEMITVLHFLHRHGLKGVVLRREKRPLPDNPLLVDLQGQTSILETIEALKGAQGYLGVDSALSVLAAKLFPAQRLVVKGVREHIWLNAKHYFAPRTAWPFLMRQVEAPAWDSAGGPT